MGGEPVPRLTWDANILRDSSFLRYNKILGWAASDQRIYGVRTRNGAVVSHGEINFSKALKRIEHVRVAASTRREEPTTFARFIHQAVAMSLSKASTRARFQE